jgi:hypothetical protein
MRLREFGLALVAMAPLAACQTADTMGRGAGEVRAGIGDAISAPLEDLNIKRTPVPPVLIRAESNPYAIGGMDHCEAIAAEVGSLDDALGPDADIPPADRTDSQKTADTGAKMTLGLVHSAAESALPFHSWVRQLTGAERHRRDVQAAIKAGEQRRGFLKALGMSMDCAPPAAPSWFKPGRRGSPTLAPPPRPSVATGPAVTDAPALPTVAPAPSGPAEPKGQAAGPDPAPEGR